MSLEWRARSSSLAWSNPLAWWWSLLTLVSGANIAVWFLLYRQLHQQPTDSLASTSGTQLMLLLCAVYVFGCAFRSFLPRADVQRICLFDTWLSSVVVGRSVATVAEISFAAQWAIILQQLGTMTGADTTLNAAWVIVPLILIAECFSWYGVLTTNYLGNAIENSIWAVAFFVVGIGLCRLLPEFHGPVRVVLAVTIIGIAGYLAFLMAVDVPDVPRPMAGHGCRRQQASQTSGGAPRREHALGRDARLCSVEGRDRLDVALFQCGGLGQPRAVRVLLARGSTPALSHRNSRRKFVLMKNGSLLMLRLN